MKILIFILQATKDITVRNAVGQQVDPTSLWIPRFLKPGDAGISLL
jgi:hypothetical protein